MAWLSRDKTILYLLLLAGLLLSSPARAETLVGTVLSIDKETFVVQTEPSKDTQRPARELRVRFRPTNTGHHRPRHMLPRCVRIGRPVRFSGHFNTQWDMFLAEEIRGVPGRGHHHDPTGVRSRLGRCLHKYKDQ